MHTRRVIVVSLGLAAALWTTAAIGENGGGGSGSGLTVSPTSLKFSAVANGAAPAAQSLQVSASRSTRFTAGVSTQNGGRWLSISPSGTLYTNQTLRVSANQSGLAAGTYLGTISVSTNHGTTNVPVTLAVSSSSGTGGGGTGGGSGYKLIGWNDLGMHCFDGKDYSIFGVLPPYNTIHVHLLDASGNLITSGSGYTVSYQAVTDPLTNTLNTSSAAKTNFWQYAAALGFGLLSPDVGLKGYAMPGTANTPRAMTFSAADNTWIAEGIPITPFTDAGTTNYFPMMRLVAKNSSGAVLGSTDIVLPTSDEMTCGTCHASANAWGPAKPAAGWTNNPDPAKDVKLNILKKHDDAFASNTAFQNAARSVGYQAAGLIATTAQKPVLCATCHGSNALGMAGVSGVPALTTSMHQLHAGQIDPATNQTLDSSSSRKTCYNCHPGPKTQCLRGVMGQAGMECQNCHGNLSNLATARAGWLDEPTCQNCHTGTATANSGQIVYTSVFSSGSARRAAADQTFATNANVPSAPYSLYRFSKGHGGLQCEACHGSTHGELATPISNDNVQSNNLQGHTGMLAECTACHSTMPSTTNGGPHGLHPIGPTWVSNHEHAAGGGAAACQPCHGTDYRGTILSKTQTARTMAGKTFPAGTVIGCYSCHNGPNGGN